MLSLARVLVYKFYDNIKLHLYKNEDYLIVFKIVRIKII